MGECILYGNGGSAPLNFKVVGGTTEPTNPAENTIWVNTDTEITGWIFSVTEPETPAEGMVWILTGTSSPVKFNALKKNGIQVYPLSAKQYVDGAWVDKTAKIWQGGAWVDWIVWLFKENYGSKVPLTFKSQANASIEETDLYIQSDYRSSYTSITNVETTELIDITNLSEIVMEIECTSINGGYEPTLYVSTSKSGSGGNAKDVVASVELTTTSSSKVELKLSIEGIDGEYYVGLWGIADYKVYNWYMR